MKSVATRLFDAREKKGLTQKQIADAVGVNKLTVSHWENGRQNPYRHIVKLAAVLGVSERWLMTGETDALKTVPMLGYVAAGGGAPIDPANATQRTFVPAGVSGVDFALEVAGDSMEPKISHGDIIYLKSADVRFAPMEDDTRADVPAAVVKPFDKKIVVASFNGDGILKRLEIEKKHKDKYMCKFTSLNKNYAPRILHHGDDCRIQGVAVGIWRAV